MITKKIIKEMKNLEDREKKEILQRFFKTGRGEYGEGDKFLGIKVPQTRKISKKYKGLILEDIKELIKNEYHEIRLLGLLILVERYNDAKNKNDYKKKKEIVNFYLENLECANNWDLIDLSAYKILGDYTQEKKEERKILRELIKSKNMWRRRAGIISTYALIKKGDLSETYEITKKLLNDKKDLMHKACGWMMREAGKKDEKKLLEFIETYGEKMPRTMLRYSIEKINDRERKKILEKTRKK